MFITSRDWIIKNISPKTVITVLDILSIFGRTPKSIRNAHFENNVIEWENTNNSSSYIKTVEYKYIIRQSKLNKYKFGNPTNFLNKKFGIYDLTADYNSCEAIALYNALTFGSKFRNLKSNFSFPEILRDMEKSGIALNGYFGTSPKKIARFLKKYSKKVKIYFESDFDNNIELWNKLVFDYDCYILTAYNNRENIYDMVHTMCIIPFLEQNEDNNKIKFSLLNCHGGEKIYEDLSSPCINYRDGNQMSKMISLIAIKF